MKTQEETKQQDREVSLRRNQITLHVVGKGVVAFGIWSVIKLSLSLVFYNDRVQEMLYNPETGERISELYAYFIAALLIAALVSVRMYVGFSAVREGEGKRPGPGYVVLAVLMSVSELYSAVLGIVTFSFENGSLTDMLMTAIVELSSFAVTMQLVISAIRIKRLRRSGSTERG